jgi:phosphoribosylanthranilate isomerase
MVRVKICGITNLEDALNAIKAGCDALGFVFYKKSPRRINAKKAEKIIKNLPKNIFKVGVFVDSRVSSIKNIARACGLDMLQFHGHESPEFCKKFRNYKIIKAWRIKNKNSLKNLKRYPVWAHLFDTYQPNLFGGSGKRFDWRIIKGLKIKKNIFLSGGLDTGNVKQALKLIRPDWVDVSTSVEKAPGKKDLRKVKNFIKIAKNK